MLTVRVNQLPRLRNFWWVTYGVDNFLLISWSVGYQTQELNTSVVLAAVISYLTDKCSFMEMWIEVYHKPPEFSTKICRILVHQIRIRVLSGTLIRIEYPSRETGNAVILLDMQNVLQCTKLMEVVSGKLFQDNVREYYSQNHMLIIFLWKDRSW